MLNHDPFVLGILPRFKPLGSRSSGDLVLKGAAQRLLIGRVRAEMIGEEPAEAARAD
jgi:hypothetical protein